MIPCAISRNPAGIVYIDPAPVSRPLNFPVPTSMKTYYSHKLKGISRSARACKSILAARAHSSILKYLGGSSLRAQGCLEPSMLERRSRLDSSRLVSNTGSLMEQNRTQFCRPQRATPMAYRYYRQSHNEKNYPEITNLERLKK